MIVYKALYIDGKRDVFSFETQDARLLKTLGGGESVIYRGWSFDGATLYTEKKGALYDWDKEYGKASRHRIKWDDPDVKWKDVTILK